MPKKTFRSTNPTVVIKRNKFGAITKHKVVNKRPKLILIDEKNENNWKYLKSELGYKTDSLFLEYLLNLAQRDLNSFRLKKRQVTTENEESLKNLDCNNSYSNNDKQNDSYTVFKPKSRKATSFVENEKKREKVSDNELAKRQNNSQCTREEIQENLEQEDLNEKKEFRRKFNASLGLLTEKGSKLAIPEDETSKNSKTEIAKDFDVDTLIDRNRERKVDELSTFKDLNLCNSRDRNYFSQSKNTSAMNDISSPDGGDGTNFNTIKKEGNNLKCKRNSQQKNRKREGDGIKNGKKLEEDVMWNNSMRDGLHESQSQSPNVEGNDFKFNMKIKLCIICNKRHLVGKCPGEVVGSSSNTNQNLNDKKYSDKNSNKYSTARLNTNGIYFGNNQQCEGRNVYDFDDSEREISIGDNSRWCQQLLRANDLGEDGSLLTITSVREETQNVHTGQNEEGNESDSSNSGLKLRIDESFGENLSFAESSLPDHLVLKTYNDEHGQSVYTKTHIPKSTYFGPLIGQKVREMDIADDFNMKFIWEVNSVDGIVYVSTKDEENSNWLRFLRPANSRESANLISTVKENQLYFISIRDVVEGEELVYWMDDIHSAWSKKKLEKKNCGGCNIQFSHPLYYRKHCMIFHDPSCSLTIRKYHCKICGLAVLGKEKIMKHAAELHQGKGAYQCQYCHKFFLRLNYLEMHRTYGCSKNPQRSRPLCDLCGRKFCQPQKLKVHIKRMHSDMAEVLKDFQCKSCLKILGSRAALQRHMKEVHNKDIIGACTCDRCGKMFQNKSNLKIHMLTHSGVKPFKCQQTDCTAAFTTKQCLQFHYKKVHGFTDDFIPKIERSIAYTFDAYSGGTVSEPSRCQSPKFEDRSSPTMEQRECGLDLSLVTLPPEIPRGKEKIQIDNASKSTGYAFEDSKMAFDHRHPTIGEQSPGRDTVKQEDEINKKTSSDECNQVNKIMVSKGSKKWIVAEGSEKTDDRFKSIFRGENSNASLLVEAAISAAEKDIIDKPDEKEIVDNSNEMYTINQYSNNSPGAMYESDKKVDDYGKIDTESQKPEPFQDIESKKGFSISEKANFNDILRCSSLLRINTSPENEVPKDYNISSIIRDQETETFTDIEIQDYRNRDLLEAYKESESFHEQYRAHELYRSEKLDLYRTSESELRMPAIDKFEYRDFDISNDAYRSLATNLEKYRNADIYRLRSDGYDLGVGYRELSDEREGEAQNLCLKEKSFQYETLEELARIGRDNPGFECLLVGDSGGAVANQGFGASAARGLHGMLSPRSYHPPYETESVDLSVPRPSYSSSPIYTLDLTPSRVELPTRHLDFRTHLGLSPHRFPNSRLPGLSNGGSQVSPTGYNVYSSPYVAPAARHSPTSQFQPYTSLYY